MDLCSISLSSSGQALFHAKICSFRHRHASPDRPFFPMSAKLGLFGGEDGGALDIRLLESKSFVCRSVVVRATGKKNPDNSSSSESSDKPSPEEGSPMESNPDFSSTKSGDPASLKSRLSDWRTMRAYLVQYKDELLNVDAPVDEAHQPPNPFGLSWAHPISIPETGCLLVATEKLDGVSTFERTVVLLLRSGTKDPRDGPLGVVINRPLRKKIKQMKPSNTDLATTFADCSLHFGGPLDASMFLLRTTEQSPHVIGFEQVMPGLCYGARNSLDEAANLVKKGKLRAQDFRFFVGYAGWQFDQLREEIESDYWIVVACSANLISGESSHSPSGLWEEILQLMGGSYSELSRKPKQDGS